MSIAPVNTMLVVYRKAYWLELWKRPTLSWGFKLAKQYRIAVGAIGHETPHGLYLINSRSRCPEWMVPDSDWARQAGLVPGTVFDCQNPANPIKARWLGVTDPKDGVGIHGTAADDSIGSAASHGCIRMHVPDVIELFDQVKLHTPVVLL